MKWSKNIYRNDELSHCWTEINHWSVFTSGRPVVFRRQARCISAAGALPLPHDFCLWHKEPVTWFSQPRHQQGLMVERCFGNQVTHPPEVILCTCAFESFKNRHIFTNNADSIWNSFCWTRLFSDRCTAFLAKLLKSYCINNDLNGPEINPLKDRIKH